MEREERNSQRTFEEQPKVTRQNPLDKLHSSLSIKLVQKPRSLENDVSSSGYTPFKLVSYGGEGVGNTSLN